MNRLKWAAQVYDASMSFQNEGTDRSRAWEPTGTLEQMRKELRLNIESTVEKSVMDNQMNKSKVPLLTASYFASHVLSTSSAL